MLLNTLLTYVLLSQGTTNLIRVINFAGEKLDFSFKIDGMSMVFAGLVSALWPFATLYAFEYMTKERTMKMYFSSSIR